MSISLTAMLVGGIASTVAGAIFPPVGDFFNQEAYNLWAAKIPSLPDLIGSRYLGHIDKKEYLQRARENGYDEEFSTILFNAYEQRLNPIEYINSWRRGIISEDELTQKLNELRFTDESITNLKKITEYFPSPSDLISFAVREVYDRETRDRFGMDLDISSDFLRESAKSGLVEEQAKNYWAAHWQLPAVRQGYEMLHRGVINEDDLSMLMKALDIMPFWRDKLQQISYSPLTRVDVRRMYRVGVLDEDEVFKSYKDIGYNNENAQRLTDFTKLYESHDKTTLTRSTIDKAYRKNIITRDDYRSSLSSLQIPESDIDFYESLIDYQIYEEEIDDLVDELTEQYKLGIIKIEEFSRLLNEADLPSSYVDNIIKKTVAKASLKRKLPTKSDLETWIRLNIIDEAFYHAQMVLLGYIQADIERYLTQINLEVDEPAEKFLPIKTYVRWVTAKIMTEDDFIKKAKKMGYSIKDIDKFIIEITRSEKA